MLLYDGEMSIDPEPPLPMHNSFQNKETVPKLCLRRAPGAPWEVYAGGFPTYMLTEHIK